MTGLPDLVSWMHNQHHKLVYAEDILILNDANRDFFDHVVANVNNDQIENFNKQKYNLFAIALPEGMKLCGIHQSHMLAYMYSWLHEYS